MDRVTLGMKLEHVSRIGDILTGYLGGVVQRANASSDILEDGRAWVVHASDGAWVRPPSI